MTNSHSALITWISNTNGYYDLSISSINSIKFPINIAEDKPAIPQAVHTIRITGVQQRITYNQTVQKCKWYYNSLNTGVDCKTGLILNSSKLKSVADIENQLIVIHPHLFNDYSKIFSRIYFNDSRKSMRNQSDKEASTPTNTHANK